VYFCDLLRVTVLLVAAVATALGTITVIVANQDRDSALLIFAGAWWLIAVILGSLLGRSTRAGEAMARTLASARTATSLPAESPGRIAFQRLWPIGVFALAAAAAAWVWPQVAAVGAGYAIAVALGWRRRDQAVVAIEERDGTRFYVEPSSAFSPVKLVRTPGLQRDVSAAPPGY
jgi:hypothetical protein